MADDVDLSIDLPLQAYDQHLNVILGDVEETVTTVEMDEEMCEETHAALFLTLKTPVVLSMQHLNMCRKPVMF